MLTPEDKADVRAILIEALAAERAFTTAAIAAERPIKLERRGEQAPKFQTVGA